MIGLLYYRQEEKARGSLRLTLQLYLNMLLELQDQEKRAAIQKRLYALLPGMQMNPYFLECAKAEIEAG